MVVFFVCEPEVFDFIDREDTVFENEPLERLSKENNLNAFKHNGFWQCMDTILHKKTLDYMWEKGKAPWKIW